MKFNIARMVVFMAAFGFLYSCAPVDHLQQAKNQKENQRFASALESANRAADREPNNAEVLVLRAEILSSFARSLQAADRADSYTDMVRTAVRAMQIAIEANDSATEQRAVQVKSAAFNHEYESALVFLDEKVSEENPAAMLPAIPHLENARIIQPGYEDIYESLVHVYASNNQYQEAIFILLEVRESSGFDIRRHELMGFLYYQTEDFVRATDHLQLAWMNGRGTPNAGRGLANAFKKLGDLSSEREVLEQLTEIEPENLYHHLALGKNLNNELSEMISTLKNDGVTAVASEQAEQIFSETERIESIFLRALQIEEDHILANLSAGLFLRNTAFILKQEYSFLNQVLQDENLSAKTDDLLYKSLVYLERASELDPDQPFIWAALWPVYESLDMPDQAREARIRSED